MSHRNNGTSKFDVEERLHRIEVCWQFRREGWTVEAIADHMQVRTAEVRTYLRQAYATYKAAHEEEASAISRLDLARTEDIYRWFAPKAKTGNDRAAMVCLKVLERRARMLGLDMPTAVEVGNGQSLAEMRDKLRAALPPEIGDVSFVPCPVPQCPVTTDSLLPLPPKEEPPEPPTDEEQGQAEMAAAEDARWKAELDR
jgi:hypothetical protein